MTLQDYSLKELAAFITSADTNTPLDKLPKPTDARVATEPAKRRELSSVAQTKYADFFGGLDEYLAAPDDIDPKTVQEASAHVHNHMKEFAKAKALRETRGHVVADIYRASTATVTDDGDKARKKLKAMRVREVMNVDGELIERMQRLCSYYNSKENGPQFQTRRAPSNPNILQIKRTR